MKICPSCQTELPSVAKYCFNCGKAQKKTVSAGPPAWQTEPVQFYVDTFRDILRKRVEGEHDEEVYPLFAERLYESGFRETLQRRAEQFEQIADSFTEIKDITRPLEDMVDYFVVRNCADLNAVPWSEAVLRYQGLSFKEIDLFQMALDYLDLSAETEVVYMDFLKMPMELLKTAASW